MGTSYPFSAATPASTDSIALGDDLIRADKAALAERLALEHYFAIPSAIADDNSGATAMGRHKPGMVAATFVGITTDINNLTGRPKGASAYDITTNQLKVYNGSNWVVVSGTGNFWARVSTGAAMSVTNAGVKVPFNTATVDNNTPTAAIDTVNSKVVCRIPGTYVINVSVPFSSVPAGKYAHLILKLNGASSYGWSTEVGPGSTAGAVAVHYTAMVPLALNDYLEVYMYVDSGTATYTRTYSTTLMGYKI